MNQVKLIGLENIHIGDMVHYAYLESIKKTYFVNAIYHMFHDSLFQGNAFSHKGNPDKVMLFSNSYSYRTDLLCSFNKVYDVCDNVVKMIGQKSKQMHVSYLKYLRYVLKWNGQLKGCIPDTAKRWYYLEKIYKAFIDYKEYEDYVSLQNWNIEKLVTWCDVHLIDYYFTQKFLMEYKITMTLQHGVFSSQSNEWVFTNSKSDYFLVHGQFTKDEAKRVGYDTKKMISVGLPSSINEHFEIRDEINEPELIGVVPEGESCHADNVEMISFVQKFCKKNNKKMVLKLHPTSDLELYKDVIDMSVCEAIYGKELRIVDFAKKIDVAIVRNSTGLLEMIEQLVPSYVFYSDNQKLDVFKYVNEIRFRDEDELQKLLMELKDDKILDILRERKAYFCSVGDISENYKNAIEYMK